MKRIKQLIIAAALVFGVGFVALPAATASAVNVFPTCGTAVGAGTDVCGNTKDEAEGYVKKIVNLLLYIIGAIAVVIIIVSGIMYTTSTGDSGRITKAKNTLMYAIVGLVIAFVAYAIVNFVLTSL